MSSSLDYPLEQVIQIKKDRVEEARQIVKKKQAEYDKELRQLQLVEEARNKVLNHRNDKLAQYRHALDTGTNTREIQDMKRYLEVVKEKLKEEETKVQKQKEKTTKAEKELEEAEKLLKDRKQQVEKLTSHRELWRKEKRIELDIIEEREMDELGSIIHLNARNKKREQGLLD